MRVRPQTESPAARRVEALAQRARRLTGNERPNPGAGPTSVARPDLGHDSTSGWLPVDTGSSHLEADDVIGRLRLRAAAAQGAGSGGEWAGDEGSGRRALRTAIGMRGRRVVIAALGLVAAIAVVVTGFTLRHSSDSDAGVPVSPPVAEPSVPAPTSEDGARGELDEAADDEGTAEAETAGVEADAEGQVVSGAHETAQLVVHVVGRVAAPGIVTVAAGSRVVDAVGAAGGALEDADLAAVNLAREVIDGEQIHIPAPGETVSPPPTPPDVESGGSSTKVSGPIDVNTADAAQLDTLPGIGPVLAERIVAYREEYGSFGHIDDLGEVSGIGPAVLERLAAHVTI